MGQEVKKNEQKRSAFICFALFRVHSCKKKIVETCHMSTEQSCNMDD